MLYTIEIQCYGSWKNFFDLILKNNLRTYDNIRSFAIGQWDDCTIFYLLDYNYFNKYHKMIAIDLSKRQALDTDPKLIQQINFTWNLAREEKGNATMFFIIEEVKETILNFSQGTVNVFNFILL